MKENVVKLESLRCFGIVSCDVEAGDAGGSVNPVILKSNFNKNIHKYSDNYRSLIHKYFYITNSYSL